MLSDGLIGQLDMARTFFRNSVSCLGEEDSEFTPCPGTFTVAQHVAHTAQTIDWFMEGAFGDGFDMDFPKHIAETNAVTSLAAAKEWLDRATRNAQAIVKAKSDAELMSPIPAGPIMGGAPRLAAIAALADHTAHHRGALTVYARVLGKTPAMPYGGGSEGA